jgi:hypothetical protein
VSVQTSQSLSINCSDNAALKADVQWYSTSLLSDHATMSKPHVTAVREVLRGQRFRYKLTYENATLLFDHGCLMGRIYYQGHFFTLPPLEEEPDGSPCLWTLPLAQQPALAEFCRLPKGILLFYFTLLKQVFKGRTLTCRPWTQGGHNAKLPPIPAPIRPWLRAVGWPYTSSGTDTGCRAS